MHARSALFDVYGDHLVSHGHAAAVADLVRLLAPLGIAAPAVRTAISRMVAQGWLEPTSVHGARGYVATEQAVRRLADSAARIYQRQPRTWEGTWQLVFVGHFPDRASRNAAVRDLAFLGYAELADRVWVSPFARAELDATLSRVGATATTALATTFDPVHAPVHAWDLEELAAAYDDWMHEAAARVQDDLAAHDDPEEAAYAARFRLVHEWRKFLFTDPGLPAELLPSDWPGHRAGEFFQAEGERLRPAAATFVARTLHAS
ncbi:PaaX family transcriptional regulator C-terminal domain-containing protein [Nocardioides currus]|uniref:PaaX family transcriptional regulator n=1 Tax=Nocardioides currus TaxID=2133958 RepID=A0A2R7YT37_9ACTN|nr:PaaX family transcriptional regulator C-terminal domain-containing protein [Nocardioides currus]PUA79434.1 PaaX family transcriptional regulator [Nocardioides currus]